MAKPRFRLTSQKIELAEADVVKACVSLLQHHGYYPVRMPTGLYRTLDGQRMVPVGTPGFPDYVIPAFCVEFKRPGGVLSPDQERKIEELRYWDLEVAVVDSAEAMVEWLAKRGPKR
jgi:hypothetical protein